MSGVIYVCEMKNPKLYSRVALWCYGQPSAWRSQMTDDKMAAAIIDCCEQCPYVDENSVPIQQFECKSCMEYEIKLEALT